MIDSLLSIAVSAILFAVLRPVVQGYALNLLFGTAWLLVVSGYCVVRFGGSPGKLLLKLRIVALDGEPLTYRHALLRALPDYILVTVGVLIGAWAIAQLDGAAFDRLSARERADHYGDDSCLDPVAPPADSVGVGTRGNRGLLFLVRGARCTTSLPARSSSTRFRAWSAASTTIRRSVRRQRTDDAFDLPSEGRSYSSIPLLIRNTCPSG